MVKTWGCLTQAMPERPFDKLRASELLTEERKVRIAHCEGSRFCRRRIAGCALGGHCFTQRRELSEPDETRVMSHLSAEAGEFSRRGNPSPQQNRVSGAKSARSAFRSYCISIGGDGEGLRPAEVVPGLYIFD